LDVQDAILHDDGANEKFSARFMGVFHGWAGNAERQGNNTGLAVVTY